MIIYKNVFEAIQENQPYVHNYEGTHFIFSRGWDDPICGYFTPKHLFQFSLAQIAQSYILKFN